MIRTFFRQILIQYTVNAVYFLFLNTARISGIKTAVRIFGIRYDSHIIFRCHRRFDYPILLIQNAVGLNFSCACCYRIGVIQKLINGTNFILHNPVIDGRDRIYINRRLRGVDQLETNNLCFLLSVRNHASGYFITQDQIFVLIGCHIDLYPVGSR